MTLKALVVGIDRYEHISSLGGCVSDARTVASLLKSHAKGTHFGDGVRLIEGSDSAAFVTRSELRDAIEALFVGQPEVALLYFAGHGHIESTGGYLCAGDCRRGEEGLPLGEILHFANTSNATHKVIILDSCHSGIAGDRPAQIGIAELADGVSILAASTADQQAFETNGSGVFTALLVDGLAGSAANLVGHITPGSLYAHIDQSLGPWAQRPVFKTNVERFVSLRQVTPPIPLDELQRIAELFPKAGHHFPLDPSYEEERSGHEEASVPAPNPENTKVFAILQKYNRNGLLVPEGAPHLWHAAMWSKAARLTALGEHYRRLAAAGRL